MGALTEQQIKAWIRAGDPVFGKSDGDGLTFTLSKGGQASWVLRYRFGGKGREVTIGNYPDVRLADARIEATRLRAKVDQGIDVAAEKRKAKLAHRLARTFSELADQYLELAGPSLKENSRKEVERYLTKDIRPRLGNLPASDIGAADIINLVERIAQRSQSVARRAFEIVSVIFSFGVARHIVPRNVCVGLKISAILGGVRARRKRIMLTEEELRIIMPAMGNLGAENGLALKILLATCTRKSELLKARWADLDLERALWMIPVENAKNKRPFTVPLAPTVVGWFKELQAIAGDSPFVLPARKRGYGKKSPTASRSTLNAALDRLNLGVREFSPHDLRSTARSHLSAMGVGVVVAERCLNHELGGLLSVYDQHDYLDERRRVLESWAQFLEECERGEARGIARNVVPLKAY